MYGKSGIGVYLEGILDHLPQNNISYLLFGEYNKLKKYESSFCNIINTDVPAFSLKELFHFPTRIVNTCDYYYTPNFNIPLGIKIPILSTIHDVVFLDVPNIVSPIGKFIRYLFLKYATVKSHSIFTVSEFSKKRINQYFNPTNIIVTYNGLSKDIKQYKTAPSQKLYDFDYILYVGNIKKHKGISFLLEAYKLLTDNNNFQKKLVIVGNANNFKSKDNDILKFIKDNNISRDIIFTGYLNNDELYNVISHASLLIQPSLYEGFGIPPLEAMYLNTPVLLSDIEVFKELYNEFPVTFFKVGDVNDLFEKIKLHTYKKINLSKEQEDLYNYYNTTQIIINTIKNFQN